LTGLAPLAVVFSSAGTTDPEGQPLTYNWNFGDGTTSTSANPSHTYTAAGTYTAQLTASDGTSNTVSSGLKITVSGYLPPVVAVSASALTGVAPLAVVFSSAGTTDPEGQPLTYSWNFGDGTTSTSANPSHTYTAAGSYTAQLTASDGTTNAISSTLNITVSAAQTNQTLVAVASATPTSGTAPLDVTFSSAGSSNPRGAALTYYWNFGDGTTSTNAYPNHTYSAGHIPTAGNFLVQLTVSDGTNMTTASNVTVNVAGVVAAYGFEATNGNAVVNDATGSIDATNSNATLVLGKFGSALAFNGTNSVVSVNNSMVSALASNMTIEAWVIPSTVGNSWMPVVGKAVNSSQLGYVVQGATPQNGVPSLYIAPSSSNLYGSTPLPTNTWSHIAVTYNGTNICLYVNGSLVTSRAQSGAPTTSNIPLTIGSDGLLQSYWNGAICEVRIYNMAISAAQIQTDMNTPIVPIPAPPKNLRVVVPPF
jgi:PKD repeat protein